MKVQISNTLVHTVCTKYRLSELIGLESKVQKMSFAAVFRSNVVHKVIQIINFLSYCTSLVPSCVLSLGGKGRERGPKEGLGLVVVHSRRDQNSRVKLCSQVQLPALI